ncbi:hypothetical protein M413DRAFT_449938 [Hebeloma cylindrosporum]|uniref:Uncharacterized protein n=1 Tax=Hebeloma cylindrosporum TaxID=76867 RepID=A0A0C2Y1Q2_HEBCY|nr:hypothetical protein M413DRAFT_449938 [Hebeloma cylindrosporum h7]
MRRLPAVYFNPADYEHLPENYQPPQDGSAGFRNGKDALIAELPTPNLPKGLIPKRGLHVQPPCFQYGWTLSHRQLFETATRSGFAAFKTRNLPPGTEPGLDRFAGHATQEILVKRVRDELGISSCTPKFVFVHSKELFCIALTSNYKRGNITPPEADVEAIRNFLGLEEPAAWFLDAHISYQWEIRRF